MTPHLVECGVMSGKDLVPKKGILWAIWPWRRKPRKYIPDEVIRTKEDLLDLIEKVNETGVGLTLTEKTARATIGLSIDPDTGSVTIGYKGKVISKSITISPPNKSGEKPSIDITEDDFEEGK